MFRSLVVRNYRLWVVGAVIANVGGWMLRTAQDWLVLTELTDHDASALGVTLALQFGPPLFLAPIAGYVIDRFDTRRVVQVAQGLVALNALALSVLVLSGVAQLWHVYALALALGVVSAFEVPARQSFISQLVGVKFVANAVALNAAQFNLARMIGPAIAGLLTATVSTGWVFLIAAVALIPAQIAILTMRTGEIEAVDRSGKDGGGILGGFRYVAARRDLRALFLAMFLLGAFVLNFPIFIATMSTVVFGRGPAEFGLLSSIMAVGSVVGALLSARRERPRYKVVTLGMIGLGVASLTAALAPNYWVFGVALALSGLLAITTLTTANGIVQSTVPGEMRGRVMALYMSILMGGTPLGAPVIGLVVNSFGPRWGLLIAAATAVIAVSFLLLWMLRHKHLRVEMHLHSSPHVAVNYDRPAA